MSGLSQTSLERERCHMHSLRTMLWQYTNLHKEGGGRLPVVRKGRWLLRAQFSCRKTLTSQKELGLRPAWPACRKTLTSRKGLGPRQAWLACRKARPVCQVRQAWLACRKAKPKLQAVSGSGHGWKIKLHRLCARHAGKFLLYAYFAGVVSAAVCTGQPTIGRRGLMQGKRM